MKFPNFQPKQLMKWRKKDQKRKKKRESHQVKSSHHNWKRKWQHQKETKTQEIVLHLSFFLFLISAMVCFSPLAYCHESCKSKILLRVQFIKTSHNSWHQMASFPSHDVYTDREEKAWCKSIHSTSAGVFPLPKLKSNNPTRLKNKKRVLHF